MRGVRGGSFLGAYAAKSVIPESGEPLPLGPGVK